MGTPPHKAARPAAIDMLALCPCWMLELCQAPALKGTQGNPFLRALFFTMVNLLMKT